MVPPPSFGDGGGKGLGKRGDWLADILNPFHSLPSFPPSLFPPSVVVAGGRLRSAHRTWALKMRVRAVQAAVFRYQRSYGLTCFGFSLPRVSRPPRAPVAAYAVGCDRVRWGFKEREEWRKPVIWRRMRCDLTSEVSGVFAHSLCQHLLASFHPSLHHLVLLFLASVVLSGSGPAAVAEARAGAVGA